MSGGSDLVHLWVDRGSVWCSGFTSVFRGFLVFFLVADGVFWVMLGFYVCLWVVLGFSGFLRVSPGFSGFGRSKGTLDARKCRREHVTPRSLSNLWRSCGSSEGTPVAHTCCQSASDIWAALHPQMQLRRGCARTMVALAC